MTSNQKLAIASCLALVSLAMGGCNPSADVGAAQLSCTVTQQAGGSLITCPDGSSSLVPGGLSGATGATGIQGVQGAPGGQGLGAGLASTAIPAGDPRCSQGNGGFEYITFIDPSDTGLFQSGDTVTSTNYLCNGATGAAGATGAQGLTGAAGADGLNGLSSSIGLVAATEDECPAGGWVITVTNGGGSPQSYPLCNGATGATGAQGPAAVAPLSLVQMIAPCGVASSAWKEELLLFSDGSLLADFSDDAGGQDTRLSLIPDGTYEDTDDSGCIFSVQTSGSSRTLSWQAGSSSDDPAGWAAGGLVWTMPVGPQGAVPISSN